MHGHVTAFERIGSNGGLARYRVVIEPWLALLRERVGCGLGWRMGHIRLFKAGRNLLGEIVIPLICLLVQARQQSPVASQDSALPQRAFLQRPVALVRPRCSAFGTDDSELSPVEYWLDNGVFGKRARISGDYLEDNPFVDGKTKAVPSFASLNDELYQL